MKRKPGTHLLELNPMCDDVTYSDVIGPPPMVGRLRDGGGKLRRTGSPGAGT